MATDRPVHIHDCPNCEFVTTISMFGSLMDGYVCGGYDRAVVIRHGDRPTDYWKCPPEALDTIAGIKTTMRFYKRPIHSGMGILALWVIEQAKERGIIPKELS
jgi:hypothetical protein